MYTPLSYMQLLLSIRKKLLIRNEREVLIETSSYYSVRLTDCKAITEISFFHPADPQGVTWGGLPGIPTQL